MFVISNSGRSVAQGSRESDHLVVQPAARGEPDLPSAAGCADTPMSALAGGMAARAGDAPMKEPVAEAAAVAPATCGRRRLLTEEDISHLSVGEGDCLVFGAFAHGSGGRA